MVFPFYSCLCVCILLLLLNVDCWQVLQYGRVDEWGPVATIPDPKWHFFEVFADNGVYFAADLTPSAPVLRYCALDELYRVYIKKGDPRFELLILMHHANGEHLVNLTYDDGNVHLNNKFLFKCKVWIIPGDRTELHIRKEKLGFILWATTERQGLHLIGNGPNENPEHEWQYVMSEGRRCFEIKAKVAVGSVKFTVLRKWIGWPTEPYDDVFFETTTTITTTTTTTTNVPENGDDYQEGKTTLSSTVNKASTMQGLIYAVCGILVLMAAAMLFFLGFRFGRCFARKRALKTGLLKSGVKESNASEPGSDTGAITPNASANQAETTKMPTKAVASIPTAKTNTEKNPVHAKSAKPTPITPTTKDEVESSTVPTEPQLISNKSNRTV